MTYLKTCAAVVKRELYLPASSSDFCFDNKLEIGNSKKLHNELQKVSFITFLLFLCRNVYLSIPVSFLNISSNFNILVRETM